MEYCYSGTESLWYGSWNRHVCRKGKFAADRHSRSTGVNPRRKQRCCSPSCLWSQAQRDTSDPDNSQNLGYWLTIRHRCICMWSWTENHLKSDLLIIWTACAHRVLNPHRWFLATQSSLNDEKMMPKSTNRAEVKKDGVIQFQSVCITENLKL